MSLDLQSLYPNFHAEATRHPSSSPRPTSGKGTGRKKLQKVVADRSLSPSKPSRLPLPTKRIANNQRLPVGSNQFHRGVSSRPMPPLSGSAFGARPATPGDARIETSRERPSTDSQPRMTQPPLPTTCESPEDATLARDDARLLSKTRSNVLRGDLTTDTTNERIPSRDTTRTPPSSLPRASSLATLTAKTLPLQELVQGSARPRSRYARRELAAPIQPLPPRLSQSASSPALSTTTSSFASRPSSSSSAAVSSGPLLSMSGIPLRGSQSTGMIPVTSQQHARDTISLPLQTPMLSWTEQDASSFFLTEIDAKDVADQWTLARALARGAHLLYAKHDSDRAVACFGDALGLVQQQQQQQHQHQQDTTTSLTALLHHHMGVAFHDDGHAKWALLLQKKALEQAQSCRDSKLEARALKALGVLFLDRDEPHHALDCQQQALALAVASRDAELEARVYANLGNLAAAQFHYDHAIVCHTRDLSACLSPELDSAVGQARAHRNLAMVYSKMGTHQHRQLAHELAAARLEAANAFETDMRRHPSDVVGNIYWQLTAPDGTLASMVATSIQELLTSRDDDREHSR